jgi:para-aminobenzoate synthetase component 1
VGLSSDTIKQKLLCWGSRHSSFLFLDSCGYPDPYGRYEWIAAVGEKKRLRSWQELHAHSEGQWLFGHISYDAFETLPHFALRSKHLDQTQWSPITFFIPEAVVALERGSITPVLYAAPEDVERLQAALFNEAISEPEAIPAVSFSPALAEQDYLQTIEALREHIAAGDCYEINFCNARHADAPLVLSTLSVFQSLVERSPAPFAAYYQTDGLSMTGASPERYLRVSGKKVLSQPIKGTARRHADPFQDKAASDTLRASPKEQAENVMIVDLTRSDLARVCEVGSIQVDELFGIQSFPAVHQLVSTVSGTLQGGKTWVDALEASFPMGSMTGAPKRKVIELIDRYEPARRGLFSGTVGYVSPSGAADFNVVIRSLFYDQHTQELSYSTGGAITWGSDPVSEWEETLLKGEALERLFKP